MDFANDGAHIRFWKNQDCVDIFQRRENLRALGGGHHRTAFTF